MTTKFLRNADSFSLVNSKSLNVYDTLPGGNYVIKKTPEGVMYLEMVDEFKHPKKMYGDTMQRADRIRKTFSLRKNATGVLLSGEKGSGKTLLCRTVCIEAAKQDGIPTIIINAPWAGDSFFSFLSAIRQPCIVLFDEFEKVYDTRKNEQDAILTLLDGVFPSQKLFLLTCNDRAGINHNMINRPGRIFYSLEFKGLDENFIRAYTADNLRNQEYLESVVRVTHVFSEFNFDMLQALIEEMNRYNENAADALMMLNVSPVHDYAKYKTNVLLGNGRIIDNNMTSPSEIRSPMAQKSGIHMMAYSKRSDVKVNNNDDDDDYEGYETYQISFSPADVVSLTGEAIVMKNKAGDILNLTKEKFESYSWKHMSEEGVL